MGLGPGGQPINANRLGGGGGMGSMGPGGQSARIFSYFLINVILRATLFTGVHHHVSFRAQASYILLKSIDSISIDSVQLTHSLV